MAFRSGLLFYFRPNNFPTHEGQLGGHRAEETYRPRCRRAGSCLCWLWQFDFAIVADTHTRTNTNTGPYTFWSPVGSGWDRDLEWYEDIFCRGCH